MYFGHSDATNALFLLSGGKIISVNVCAVGGFCDGTFGTCCGWNEFYFPGLDDAWFQHFVDLGKPGSFPWRESDFSPKIIKYITEPPVVLPESLDLRFKKEAEGIADLAKIQTLKHLKISFANAKDAEERAAMKAAYFDLFPKLPNLEKVEMYENGRVTELPLPVRKLAE